MTPETAKTTVVTATPADRPADRFADLDGLRGWAAVSVVVFHLTWEVFGAIHPQFRSVFLAFLLDGALAVSIFFVLSGEVLTYFFFNGKIKTGIKLAVKRYPRLVIPVFFSCLLVFLLKTTSLTYNKEAAAIVDRDDWLGFWLQFDETIRNFLYFCFISCFTQVDPPVSYNPFLWTMRIELFGSYLAFFVLIVIFCGRKFSRYRMPDNLVPVLAFITLECASFYYGMQLFADMACFPAGIVAAKLRADGAFNTPANSTTDVRLLLFGSLFIVFDSVANIMHLEGHREFFAIPIVFLLQYSRHTKMFFSNPVSQFFGKISFPLYLIQFPIIVSFTSYAIVMIPNDMIRTTILMPMLIATASFGLCILAAYAFIPVEHLTKRVGDTIYAIVERCYDKVAALIQSRTRCG